MAVVYNGLFGSNQSKTAGVSLTINPADITLATGDDIFLAYAGDDVGSAFGMSDSGTASITWTQEKEQIYTGNVKTQLWRGNCTSGGTLLDITISWTTDVTAKAAVAGWFSGVGTQDRVTGANSATARCTGLSTGAAQTGDLCISANGYEGPNGDDVVASNTSGQGGSSEIGQNGTTSGGAASNVTVTLSYLVMNVDQDFQDLGALNNTSARDNAGAGAVYSPAATGPVVSLLLPNRSKSPILRQR